MKWLYNANAWKSAGLIAMAAAVCAAGCAEYNAPPEPKLERPEGGAFALGAPLTVDFSEPIDPQTLVLTIWPNQRGPEGEIADGVEPLVDHCTVETSPCGDLTLALNDDATSAELTLDGDLGQAGRPLLLEVAAGLADPQGNDTGISFFYNFQFRGDEVGNDEPVTFDNGVYMLGATVEQPIPAVLTLISDIRVSEDGTFALAGTAGKVADGEPKTTLDPDKITIKSGGDGWTVYAQGTVTVDPDGKRLLETGAFDVYVPLGILDVKLENMRMFATIKKDPQTDKDSIEGTLSYEQVILIRGDTESASEGSSTAFRANYIPTDKIPEGHAEVCGDLCGVVEGHCDPPQDFPPDAVCESQ